ncbi:MAG: divalent-cation tolerance protein CutA [Acidimicrobiales bacterium]
MEPTKKQSDSSEAGPTGVVQVQFTIEDPGRGDAIIGSLLSERLAACGQRLGPVISRYWWRGAVERSDEWLVVLKTRDDLAGRAVASVMAHHPYETPEVVVIPVVGGAPDYLAWVVAETAEPSDCESS